MNQEYGRRPRKRRPAYGKLIFLLLVVAAAAFGAFYLADTVGNLLHKEESSPQAAQTELAPENAKQDVQKLPETIPETAGDHDYSILIVKGEHTLYLLDHGEKVAAWGCAIGKGGAGQKTKPGDNMTPTGNFYIDEIDDASSWSHDFHDGKGVIEHAYGPWFLSLDTTSVSKGKWDGIGIHGTHDPASIETNASEGCIRLKNENLRKLKKVVKVGTKVTIVE
ncbi:MAG: L,D-transpeptidase [Acidaminococcus sp.]|nr:L,D-transpeptidase [Acidaminococcus sp.]